MGRLVLEGHPRKATTIDDVLIGGAIPAAGTFSSLSSPAVTLTGGTVDNTPVGGTTPVAGAFTTLSANSTFTAVHINAVSHENQVICHDDEILFV